MVLQDTVVVVGSGAREHAIADAISSSESVRKVIVAPGNYGTSRLPKAQNVPLQSNEEILKYCEEEKPEMVIICPEAPLAEGLGDSLREGGFRVFGPNKNGAKLEYDKAWAKNFMKEEGIPTADYQTFSSIEEAISYVDRCPWDGIVVKASGLAAGKGVFVAEDKSDARKILHEQIKGGPLAIRKAAETIILEEYLDGYELSVHIVCDGKHYAKLPTSQDHKRRFEANKGPNTGGMGAISPVVVHDEKVQEQISEICEQTVNGLAKRNIEYIGVIYIGLMITDSGPKVLEYNCRFGDPETQAIVPLIKNFYDTIKSCTEQRLQQHVVKIESNVSSCAVCVVIAAYPQNCSSGYGKLITGCDELEEEIGIKVFYAGTKYDQGPVTSGGRVLTVCAQGKCLEEANKSCLEAVKKIKFSSNEDQYKASFRSDIGFFTILRERTSKSKQLSYRDAGVDIDAGNDLVNTIKKMVEKDGSDNSSPIGHFGALYKIGEKYEDPILVSGADGVGTKLMVAQDYGKHGTIGQDLVAMCVNDIIVCGATPLFFLDYFATGKLEKETASEVIRGISSACSRSGCSLVGGETAELPGMYGPGKYDLAGFAVGIAEKKNLLPRKNQIKEGDLLVGISSSGLHSNGFSLVRKVIERLRLRITDVAPYNPDKTLAGETLLEPTKLYTDLLPIMRMPETVAAAHITGGGLYENIKRVLPHDFAPKINSTWKIPDVFLWLMGNGISWEEMLRTFNLGVGMVLILSSNGEETDKDLLEAIRTKVPHHSVFALGTIEKSQENLIWSKNVARNVEEQIVLLKNRALNCFPPLLEKKIAVLISGNGTNLQALIDHTNSGMSAARICLVVSNVPGVKGLTRASHAKIPSKVIDHKNYKNRTTFEEALTSALEEYGIELICLAGFMRILSSTFIERWRGKCINVHPSLLPSFKGKDAQKQALEAGVKITGCSVHFVNEGVDCGSLISQEAVAVLPGDTEDTLSERIRGIEHKIYPLAMEAVARGEIHQAY